MRVNTGRVGKERKKELIVGDDEGRRESRGSRGKPRCFFLLGFGSRLLLLSTNQLPPPIRGPAMIYRSVLFVYLSSFLLHLQIFTASLSPPYYSSSSSQNRLVLYFIQDAFYSGKSARSLDTWLFHCSRVLGLRPGLITTIPTCPQPLPLYTTVHQSN